MQNINTRSAQPGRWQLATHKLVLVQVRAAGARPRLQRTGLFGTREAPGHSPEHRGLITPGPEEVPPSQAKHFRSGRGRSSCHSMSGSMGSTWAASFAPRSCGGPRAVAQNQREWVVRAVPLLLNSLPSLSL